MGSAKVDQLYLLEQYNTDPAGTNMHTETKLIETRCLSKSRTSESLILGAPIIKYRKLRNLLKLFY